MTDTLNDRSIALRNAARERQLAKHPRYGHPWGPDEEESLHALIMAGRSCKEAGVVLGRAPEAIRQKALLLGLRISRDSPIGTGFRPQSISQPRDEINRLIAQDAAFVAHLRKHIGDFPNA